MSTLWFGIRSLMFINHPEVHSEFQAGNFVMIRKTPNVSSGMPIDQAHEQNNSLVKGP